MATVRCFQVERNHIGEFTESELGARAERDVTPEYRTDLRVNTEQEELWIESRASANTPLSSALPHAGSRSRDFEPVRDGSRGRCRARSLSACSLRNGDHGGGSNSGLIASNRFDAYARAAGDHLGPGCAVAVDEELVLIVIGSNNQSITARRDSHAFCSAVAASISLLFDLSRNNRLRNGD